MTNIVAPPTQNVKTENKEIKNDINSNNIDGNEESENSFLSIMQTQIDELNNEPKKEVSEIKLNSKDILLSKNKLLNSTNKDNLTLLAKNSLKQEIKVQEGISELKTTNKIEDLINIANEKGLNVKKLEVSKINIQELNEKQKLVNLNNLKKLEVKKSELESKNVLVMESLKDEKAQEIKDSLLSNLLKGNAKAEPQKDSFVNSLSLESLLQKDENMVGKRVKRDKFSIQALKSDKITEQVDVKKEISLELKLDGNQKTSEVEVRNKMVDAKTTINHFTNNLKEKMQEYKAPLMKMELTLNPKELGNVDVTLVTRGNSVHVNLASNSQAMQLFAQNATEFKNSLANIGFDNVEMNFNSNQNSEQGSQNPQDGQQHQKVFKYYADNNTDFSLEELKELEHLNSIDLIIPDYA